MKSTKSPSRLNIKKPILVIDGDNQLYRAFFANQGLTTGGKSTSAIFGVPKIVASLIKKFQPSKIIIVWDGRKAKERVALLPNYKESKARLGFDKTDLIRQKEVLKRIFRYLGIPQVYDEFIEGDDHLAMVVDREYNTTDKDIVIVSADKDFRQLLSERISIWDDRDNFLTTKGNCKNRWGYRGNQCVDYLILTGDHSDNIPGYGGIGEKRAPQFLDQTSIKAYLKDTGPEIMKIDRKKLKEVYKRNSMLIDLRKFREAHLSTKLPNYTNTKGKVNTKRLFRILDRFGIKSFKQPEFLNPFYNL